VTAACFVRVGGEHFVELEYTVTADGQAEDVRAVSSDVIGATERSVAAVMRKARFRPRFVDGEPLSAKGIRVRQIVYVRDAGECRSPTATDSPPPRQTRLNASPQPEA
jgi:TonB family protein